MSVMVLISTEISIPPTTLKDHIIKQAVTYHGTLPTPHRVISAL